MLTDLKSVLNTDEDLDAAQFNEAAQLTLASQFLWRGVAQHKVHYDLIVTHKRYFENLFEAFNHRLVIEERCGYVGVVPLSAGRPMPLEEALMLLVLRYIYDQRLVALHVEEDGSTVVPLTEFQDVYQKLTERELPKKKGRFMAVLGQFSAQGLARYADGGDDGGSLRLLPSLQEILDGEALELLGGYLQANGVRVRGPAGEIDQADQAEHDVVEVTS